MDEPARHRPEPEIIPPGAPLPHGSGVWVAADAQRIYTARLGPVRLTLIALAVSMIGTIGLVVLAGVAVIALIAAGVLAAAFLIAGILRKPTQPLR